MISNGFEVRLCFRLCSFAVASAVDAVWQAVQEQVLERGQAQEWVQVPVLALEVLVPVRVQGWAQAQRPLPPVWVQGIQVP